MCLPTSGCQLLNTTLNIPMVEQINSSISDLVTLVPQDLVCKERVLWPANVHAYLGLTTFLSVK